MRAARPRAASGAGRFRPAGVARGEAFQGSQVREGLPYGRDVLVEVSDPLPDPPRERAARLEDEGGRGLHLVASSSRRWGTRPGAAGKTVWFELAVPE